MSNTGLSRRELFALVGAYLLRPNIATAESLDPFATGWAPSGKGLAISPDGRTAYVAFSLDDGVIEVDLASGATGGYDVSSAGPMLCSEKILLTPDGRNLYVANNGTENILSIDAASKRVRGVLDIPPSYGDCLTCLPDGSKVYVAGTSLYEINVADDSFRRMPPGGICFRSVAASRREPGVIYALGERACGGRQGQGLVRYRVPEGKVLLERELPYDVWHAGVPSARLILSAQEDIGYLGTCTISNDRGYGKLYVLDLKTLEVTASCDIDYGVTDFVLREDARRIYTIGFWSGGSAPGRLPVTEWDTASRAVSRQMFFNKCSDLRAIALNPVDPGIAWYTEGDHNEIRAVDLASGGELASWRFSPASTIGPYSFATAGWETIVGGQASGRLFRIDMRTGMARELRGPLGSNRGGFYSGGQLHYLKPDRIVTYDPDQETVVRELLFGLKFNPLCGTPAGDAVAFVDSMPGSPPNLVVVDVASGQPRKVIPLPALPVGHRVIVSPEGNKAYLPLGTMQGPARILVYDLPSWDLRAEVVPTTATDWESGNTNFSDGVFDARNRVAYILGFTRVFRLDMDSDRPLDSLRPADSLAAMNRQNGWGGSGLCGIRFGAGNRLLVASGDAHTVYTYDLSAKRWLPYLMNARGYFLTDGTASPDGRFFFTANTRSDSVSMFDVFRGRLLRVIDLHAPTQNRLLRANVVNAASLLAGPVAPGEVITIFGAGLGPEEGLTADQGPAGVRVLFDGVEATLLYVQSTQIYARVPEGVTARPSVRLAIDYQGQVTEELELGTAESAPGLFTLYGTGAGPALALDGAKRVVTEANPAARGSLVTLFLTGAGRTGSSLPLTAAVGGLTANVEFTAPMPGSFVGVLMCGVRVPRDATPGPAQPVLVRSGAQASQPGVTLAVA
ncbi:MAG: IPT/TIG domain-containing protein [Bryobacteraceae bacterium]